MTKIKNKRLLECGFRFCCLDWWFNRRIMIWLILMMWMIFPARFGHSRDLDYLISNEKIKTDKPRIRLTSRNIFGYLWSLVYSRNYFFNNSPLKSPTLSHQNRYVTNIIVIIKQFDSNSVSFWSLSKKWWHLVTKMITPNRKANWPPINLHRFH